MNITIEGHTVPNVQPFSYVYIVYLRFATQLYPSCPVDQGAYVSEQMEYPVTFEQFHSCVTDAYCSLFHLRIVQ